MAAARTSFFFGGVKLELTIGAHGPSYISNRADISPRAEVGDPVEDTSLPVGEVVYTGRGEGNFPNKEVVWRGESFSLPPVLNGGSGLFFVGTWVFCGDLVGEAVDVVEGDVEGEKSYDGDLLFELLTSEEEGDEEEEVVEDEEDMGEVEDGEWEADDGEEQVFIR